MMADKAAGLIGDEILKGHVKDTNSHYLAKELWSLGVNVAKISVIADSLKAISEEVKLFSSQYEFVITTGGIGPTHDDVTMKGIADAFDETLIAHPTLVKMLSKSLASSKDHQAFLKMTHVPKSSIVYSDDQFVCPLIGVHNVYPFPGVPSQLKKTFQMYKHVFINEGQEKFFLKEIFYSVDEDVLAMPLASLQNDFMDVQIGSYPEDTEDTENTSFKVKVTLESTDKALVETVYHYLLMAVAPNYIMSVRNSYISLEEYETKNSLGWVENYLCQRLSITPYSLLKLIEESLDIMDKAIDKYKPDNLCVAFTGGKDCTVLLALYYILLKRRGENSPIKVLYVVPKNSFTEVEQFIDECIIRYNLNLIKLPGPIQTALTTLKDLDPCVEGILMGTRYSDPHTESLTIFSPTDSGWPQYMRIHCILNWSYSNIWSFLRIFRVPYCKLYDTGYTSLGNTTDTKPNPALSPCTHGKNGLAYQPAYSLKDEKLERAGRL